MNQVAALSDRAAPTSAIDMPDITVSARELFAVDADMEHKLLITVAPGGYLKCLRD